MQNVRSTPHIVYRKCNKNHYGSCAVRGMRCYQCQGLGHMGRDCPQNKIQMQGKSTDRVYTLDAKKANGNNALIVGTCYVNGHPSFVLFDCGAILSFVSI